MIPLFVEAGGLALGGFAIGIFLAYLLSLHLARRNRTWND
jgi:hypothetical protein